MRVLHLTDSPFFGGPERQILGLSLALDGVDSSVLCFADGATCQPFLDELTRVGIDGRMMEHTNPNYLGILGDIRAGIRKVGADILVCHGYKADILGIPVARLERIPIVSVSRGWTAHTRKVRINEAVDRLFLRRADAVVCVSEGQAAKVRESGVPGARVLVIRNAVDPNRFVSVDPNYRRIIREMLPRDVERIVVGIGRLSPEKGFDIFIKAARRVLDLAPRTGFLVVGDGPCRADLTKQIAGNQMDDRVILTGFRDDVDRLLPHVDILVQTSITEGLPNVLLEASAAGIPIVASAVGGTPEIVEDRVNGLLVPAGDWVSTADRIITLLQSNAIRREMGASGRTRIQRAFSFAAQGTAYRQLFERLVRRVSGSAQDSI